MQATIETLNSLLQRACARMEAFFAALPQPTPRKPREPRKPEKNWPAQGTTIRGLAQFPAKDGFNGESAYAVSVSYVPDPYGAIGDFIGYRETPVYIPFVQAGLEINTWINDQGLTRDTREWTDAHRLLFAKRFGGSAA